MLWEGWGGIHNDKYMHVSHPPPPTGIHVLCLHVHVHVCVVVYTRTCTCTCMYIFTMYTHVNVHVHAIFIMSAISPAGSESVTDNPLLYRYCIHCTCTQTALHLPGSDLLPPLTTPERRYNITYEFHTQL